MKIAVLSLNLYAPWISSLKEKRNESKSLLQKLRNKFNVSAAETHNQDKYQMIGISVISIAANISQADSIMDNIINFIESNTEAELMLVDRTIE